MGFFSSMFKTTTSIIKTVTEPIVTTTTTVVETITQPIINVTTTVIETVSEPIQTVTQPIITTTTTIVETVTSPIANTIDSITHAQEYADRLASMFTTFNTTMQTTLKMNQEQLQTIQRLSSDIGIMADQIGDMSDRIIITQQIQSPNYVATQENALAFFALTTNSSSDLAASNEVLNFIPDTTSMMTNATNTMFQASIDGFQAMTMMFTPLSAPTLPWITTLDGSTSISTMILSMSQTMQEMMNLSTEYVNTVIQLTHDIGTMAGRIGEMGDRIIETKELQDANFIATEENFLPAVGTITSPNGSSSVESSTSPTITMEDVTPTPTINPNPVDRTSGFETILSSSDKIGQLADGIGDTADLMVARNINPQAYIATAINATDGVLNLDNSSISQMASEFNTLITNMSLSILTAGNALDAMVAMFDSANDIVRAMITLNERFVNTALALSDDIGTMADRIGEMSDRIVETQGILSPMYLGESLPSVSVESVELQSSTLINADTNLPVDMSMLTSMTASLGTVLSQFGTFKAIENETFFDAFESMFNTANETMQMMSSVNTTYLNAILKLSDDIGLMSDRIGEMSDRILQTQVLQSENFLATQENFLEGAGLVLDITHEDNEASSSTIVTINDVIQSSSSDITALLPQSNEEIQTETITTSESTLIDTASRSEISSLTITIETTNDIII